MVSLVHQWSKGFHPTYGADLNTYRGQRIFEAIQLDKVREVFLREKKLSACAWVFTRVNPDTGAIDGTARPFYIGGVPEESNPRTLVEFMIHDVMQSPAQPSGFFLAHRATIEIPKEDVNLGNYVVGDTNPNKVKALRMDILLGMLVSTFNDHVHNNIATIGKQKDGSIVVGPWTEAPCGCGKHAEEVKVDSGTAN